MLINKKYISVKVNDEKLKASNKGLAILLEMSNYLAGSLTTKSLFEGALSRVLEHFDLEAGRIYLLNGAGQYLYLVSHQGMAPHGLERVSINEGFSGKAVRTKSFIAQHVSDLEDRKRSELLSDKGFNIVLCVPLITMDRVRGVMNLATSEDIQLDQDKIEILPCPIQEIYPACFEIKMLQDPGKCALKKAFGSQ